MLMTTKMEKKMIGQFYTLTEENIVLKNRITELEQKLVESNHRNLDWQYMYDGIVSELEEKDRIISDFNNTLTNSADA
jgi:hypothetical protein